MIPAFTAEAALGTSGVYRSVHAPGATDGRTVTPATMVLPGRVETRSGSGHGGECISFCDPFGCIWCCGGTCDPEYH